MQILLNGLIVGSAYAILGIGFSLLYSTTRYFNLAFGIVAVIGAYVTWTLIAAFSVNFGIALFGGAIAGGIVAFLTYHFLFRIMVLRKCSSLVICVASFGLLTVLQNLVAIFWGNATRVITLTERILPGYEFFGLIITPNQIAIGAISVLMMLVLEFFLEKTKLGMGVRAIGDNPELTDVLGLPTGRIILMVVLVSAVLSSLGTSVLALEIGIHPRYGTSYLIKALIAAIVGGMGSIRGALFGGLLLGVAENLGTYFISGEWRNTVAFVLLGLVLLIRPEGLFSKRKLLTV